MSQLYGQLSLTDTSIQKAEAGAMYNGVAFMPHQKHNSQFTTGFAVGHLLTYNTPEALHERGAVTCEEDKIVFCFCGRIDNREELCRLLSIPNRSDLPDGDIALKAFVTWRQQCPEKIYGDWHFAAYDLLSKQLFLARDHYGCTALYYYKQEEHFLFASSIKAILASPHYKKQLNEEHFLNGLLAWHKGIDAATYYKNIYFIPPGSYLLVKEGSIKVERYWFPEKVIERHGKTSQQYADELHHIFEEAVHCRLRSYKPVACQLSGGLDSGSVAVTAAELLKETGKTLTAFSHVPLYKNEIAEQQKKPEVRRTLDETNKILAICEAAQNIRPVLLNSANISPLRGMWDALQVHNKPFHGACNAFWIKDIPEQIKKNDFGCYLTGEMGNATISLAPVLHLISTHHKYFKAKPKLLIKQKVIKPIVIKYFLPVYERLKKDYSYLNYIKNSMASKTILDKWKIIEKAKREKKSFNYLFKNKHQYLTFFFQTASTRLLGGASNTHFYGVEQRDPTGDARLIEYIYSIPMDHFLSDDGSEKNIMKLMMKDKLPDTVLFQKKKGLQASDVQYRLREHAAEVENFLESLNGDKNMQHFFDLEKMEKEWQQIKDGEIVIDRLIKVNSFMKGLMWAKFLKDF